MLRVRSVCRALAGRRVACVVAGLALTPVPGCAPPAQHAASDHDRFASEQADWNEDEVAWRSYEAGLEEARATGKPIVLIFYTDWCPHCHNYSRLFHDAEVVDLAASFVMIRVERDSHRDISARYAFDGEYIPRTFFLTPKGELLAGLESEREEHRYYLDEHDPSELISRMREARARAGASSEPPG